MKIASTLRITDRFRSAGRTFKSQYLPLIKILQTALLLSTGLAGYMSARCPYTNWQTVLGLAVSLFLAISGSTVLNMILDRDIDAKMERTSRRPLPSGKISIKKALSFGLIISALGIGMALAMDLLYGLLVFSGLFIDVVIYTLWLKRRTAWSIVFGGISGGIPILAGRALGMGEIDWIGIALLLAILFWIPTHILTFSIRHFNDYGRGGIPTFASVYGFRFTRITIALSSFFTCAAMVVSAYGIGLSWGFLRVLSVLTIGLVILAVKSLTHPSEKLNFYLFKYASLFMLGSMLLIAIS